MPRRLLIASLSLGGGHGKASEVVAAAVADLAPGWEVRRVDLRDHMAPWLRRLYADGYLFVVRRVPWLYGFLYRHPPRRGGTLPRWMLRRGLRSFERLVRGLEPDAILATQVTASEAVDALRARGVYAGATATVVTDFDAHPSWRADHIDRFFVPDAVLRDAFVGLGIPADRVEVTGVPVDPAFEADFDLDALRATHGVRPGVPVVLMMGGSLGLGGLARAVEGLVALGQPLDLRVVAGHNERLRQRLERVEPSEPSRLQVYGYIDFVAELMAVADVFVSKPGGLSMTEALTVGVPTVVFAPLPGQEEANAAHLDALGVVRRLRRDESIADAVAALLADRAARRALTTRARAYTHAHPAQTLACRLLTLAGEDLGEGTLL